MKTTNYAGIDYGLGGTNIDKETGIRFSIIPQNYLNDDALDSIYNGRDLGYESAEQEIKNKIRGAIEDYFSDWKDTNGGKSRLDQAVEDAFDVLDGWAEGLECSGPYRYEKDGYILRTTDYNELWVLKSPYFTYAQFCSPCAPGACHLEHPLEAEEFEVTEEDVKTGNNISPYSKKPLPSGPYKSHSAHLNNKCYALGPDWFKDGECPYDLFLVSNGEKHEE